MDPDQINQLNESGGIGIGGIIGLIVYLALVVITIVAIWKVNVKAGEAGWACLIPVYNLIVMLKIAVKPIWWIILLLIVPFVNIVIWLLMMLGVAKGFGKGAGFGIGLFFLPFIFFPMLGFGDAVYIGPKTP